MFLKFWIISTIICCLLFYTVFLSINKEVKELFTKEELKELKKKKKKSKYAWYIYILVFICPILNILFILIVGGNYGQMKETIICDFKYKLNKLTPM